jgi:DNA-binding winged helix-turn-helix (wHTH) protein
MEAIASSEVFLFEGFRLDRRGGGLFRRDVNGSFTAVAISSRGLNILGVLIGRAGEVVSKDEIIAAVWPGTVVEESNLTVQISALRRALEHGRPNGRCIQTVPRRGYRFAALVTPAAVRAPPVPAAVGVEAIAELPAPRLPVAAPRLSIVVLPFTNLSNNPEQQYFADGMTDDLTTDLSRITHMFVIARKTAFTYWKKPIAAKQIGRELGVRYVLEGSVQWSGRSGPRQCPADRGREQCAFVGRAVRWRYERPVRSAKRDHYQDRRRPQPRADSCGGRASNRASRRAGVHSPRLRRLCEADIVRTECRRHQAVGTRPGARPAFR